MVVMVRSLKRSLPWYSAMLGAIGFEKTREHLWWNGSVAIDLKEAEAGTRDYERRGPGLNHLGFTAPDRAALDAVRTAMADVGFDVPEVQTFACETATFFEDPDGMRVEVTVYA